MCSLPPLQKYYRQLFLFGELISFGLPEKSVTWLPEIISGELISMGLPETVAGSQRSVRRCELVANKDSGNICNAITGKYSVRINLEQLPEKSVI